jgi:hypothetical protein
MQLINNVTLLSVVLTGAALIREREHGTVEHLLAMPVTPFEIMLSKVWAMGLVVFLAALLSLIFIIRWLLAVPIEGSIILFMVGTALHLFATTSLGIFLATVSRSMPQFGLLLRPQPRCAALQGVVGESAFCTVYPDRPSPCRELEPGDERCARARARNGMDPLPPLLPADLPGLAASAVLDLSAVAAALPPGSPAAAVEPIVVVDGPGLGVAGVPVAEPTPPLA